MDLAAFQQSFQGGCYLTSFQGGCHLNPHLPQLPAEFEHIQQCDAKGEVDGVRCPEIYLATPLERIEDDCLKEMSRI
jgi:hypothetical protein